MNQQAKTRRWEGKTRSDVVREVAKEAGYEGAFVDIEDTPDTLDVINQAAETDARFLARLAEKEGFQFFIDGTGLHWHQRRQDTPPAHVFTWYSDPELGEVIAVNVESDLVKRTGSVTVKGRDPKEKRPAPRARAIVRSMTEGYHEAWLRAVRLALVKELTAIRGEWADNGEAVVGPGTIAVVPAFRHEAELGHVDIGFVLNRDRPDVPVVWDCAYGGSDSPLEAAAALACSMWARTTAPTVFELMSQRGEYAAHAHGDDGLGLDGWHSIHGPILTYGDDSAEQLQKWCLDNPIVPALRDGLAGELPPTPIHGVKFLLGAFGDGSSAEVRIDGERSEACSDALLRLRWPKTPSRVVRFFVLFVHPLQQ